MMYSFILSFSNSWLEEGQADYEKGTAISVVVYDRSMKMDGPCAVNRCMTDGKLENVEFFFLDFLALVGLLPAGDMYLF